MTRFIFIFLGACAHSAPPSDSALCRVIPALPGPEDLVFDASRQRWLGSWAERRGKMSGASGIFSLKGEQVQSLPIRGEEALLPVSTHGIDWLESSEHLFVVDHVSPREHRVLRLALDRDGLRVEAEFSSPLMSSANDVLAVAADEFYVSVDLGSSTVMGRLVEALTARPWGGVLHYRRGVWRWAVQGVAFANGLALSADHKSVFIAAYQQGEILQFSRDLQTGRLADRSVYAQIPGHPDNLTWSRANDSLLVASHDSLWELFWHLRDPASHASGGVYRVPSRGQVERIFWDDGHRVDAPSVALESSGYLLIGQVFDDELLLCAQGRSD